MKKNYNIVVCMRLTSTFHPRICDAVKLNILGKVRNYNASHQERLTETVIRVLVDFQYCLPIRTGVMSVSYTHLDVYKRQV